MSILSKKNSNTIKEDKLWEDLSSNLTLYFICGDIKFYNRFSEIFEEYFDYNVDGAKFEEMKKFVKKEEFSAITYILKKFNSNRFDYERDVNCSNKSI